MIYHLGEWQEARNKMEGDGESAWNGDLASIRKQPPIQSITL
jgi:hypothetical protein